MAIKVRMGEKEILQKYIDWYAAGNGKSVRGKVQVNGTDDDDGDDKDTPGAQIEQLRKRLQDEGFDSPEDGYQKKQRREHD